MNRSAREEEGPATEASTTPQTRSQLGKGFRCFRILSTFTKYASNATGVTFRLLRGVGRKEDN